MAVDVLRPVRAVVLRARRTGCEPGLPSGAVAPIAPTAEVVGAGVGHDWTPCWDARPVGGYSPLSSRDGRHCARPSLAGTPGISGTRMSAGTSTRGIRGCAWPMPWAGRRGCSSTRGCARVPTKTTTPSHRMCLSIGGIAFLSQPWPYAIAMHLHAGIPIFLAYWWWGLAGVLGIWVTLVALYNAGDAIDSSAHVFGRKLDQQGDESRNSRWMGVLTLGEGWHANHHRFPFSARHGLLPGQFDGTWEVIRALRSAWAGNKSTPARKA